tara:strand:+ start:1102 stop:2091 length:990 start_codon:yes stop_codon:yes gene_type:complete
MADLYDGVDSFTQNSSTNTNVNYNLIYEASPLPIANWIGLPHTGTDYLYLGVQSSSGDSLVVSGMDNDAYDWTVYYTDGGTATGSGTSTTFTWAAATYGGKQITQISVVGTKTYTFLPSILTTHTRTTSTGTDSQSGTWTLTRAWEAADVYEYSSVVDRNLFQLNREGGRMAPNLAIGRDTAMSVSFNYRRFGIQSAHEDYIFHHPNLFLRFASDNLIATVTEKFDASSPLSLRTDVTWDDSSRLGQWNHVGIVRDVPNSKLILYANGVKIEELADVTLNSLASRLGIPDADVVFHTDDEPGWQFNHFAVFKEALSAADMERVRVTLPT